MTSEVTQEARNAAADLLHEVGCLLGDDGIGQVADLIRDGEYDDHGATIAFAKFERETIARMNAKPSDDKAIMRELRPSKAAMEKIERMEQANAAGLAEIWNMPFGGAAQSGEGRSGAGEDAEHLVRIFRGLPLHGDAGCDKLSDDEWRQVALAALNARQSGEGRSGAGEDSNLDARKAVNGVLAGLLAPLMSDTPKMIEIGNQACTEILASLAALNARQSGEGEREALREALAEAEKPSDDSDPWYQLGWYKDRLERAEIERDEWKDRAMSSRLAALSTTTTTSQPAARDALRIAAEQVIATADDYYTARNGRRCSIEGEDGEKCWIVGNADGTKWRCWGSTGPEWTDDHEQAIRYARRIDAERTHADDDDAWRIVPYSGEGRSNGAGEDGFAHLCDKPEWIKHRGDNNPVSPHHLVEIKHRAGSTAIVVAGAVNWGHGAWIWEIMGTAPDTDIVAYRHINDFKLNMALAALSAPQGDDKTILKELRPSKKAMEKIDRIEQANAAGMAALRDMPFGSTASPQGEVERLREALFAITQSGIDRDVKWAGMNAHDIARAALSSIMEGHNGR